MEAPTSEARLAAAGREGVSLRRLWLVAGLDLRESLRRPLFWIWAALMIFNGFLMSRGEWLFRSVDTSLGGTQAWVDSEFQIAYIFALISYFFIAYFVAVAAGMPLIRDAEQKVGEILHSTPLRRGEYVWGKFGAALLASVAAVALLPVSAGVLSHLLPDPGRLHIYGPFELVNYLRPFLMFLLPAILFTAGVAFAIGRFTGRPILVFLMPILLSLLSQNLFWRWRPPNLDPAMAAFLRYIDPSGFRWFRDSWLQVDRGLAFYNTRPVEYDVPFLLSRLGFCLVGLLLVDLARRPWTGRVRRPWRLRPAAAADVRRAEAGAPLSSLAMTARPPGRLAGVLAVTRFELAELRAQPGLYIFIPAILLFLYVLFRETYGYFYSPLLLTPGSAAIEGLGFLRLALGMLFLFYTVESLERERTAGMAPLAFSSPAVTGSFVLGKLLANIIVLAVALAGAVLVAALTIRGQGVVDMDLAPFLKIWGLLLAPTLILWMAFVAAVLAVTRNRHTTYGVSLAVLVIMLFFFARGDMNWVGNWALLDAVVWTDMGSFEIDRAALVLNRLLALSLAAFFTWVAVRFWARRERDRMSPLVAPAQRRRTWLAGSALALPPVALGLALWFMVHQGFQGGAVETRHEEYWQKNVATWVHEPLPYITRVEMDLDLEPADRAFRVSGFYDLENRKDKPLHWFPVTGGTAWRGLSWTLNGRPWTPEDRSGLYVFRLPRPLLPGDSVRLGFRYEATLLAGISRNGGEVPLGEFILPSGVIVTGRNPDFVPVIRFDPRIGVDEDNNAEPRIFPPHFHEGVTDSTPDRSAFTQRLTISAPAEYTVNSTGSLVSTTERDGRRTVVWESDYPLRVFNVAAGRWAVKRGPGTAVFYHPGHPYNVDSLLEALNGARRWYAAWFGPYPWKELRLNEFPAYANYARGNATNIFFSESVGFLSRPMGGSDMAFTVAAHEAAHQWWGHILAPGEGPGGIVLAEGAANFATLMLLEQMRGLPARLDFATEIEAQYGELRQPSTEKPLAETLDLEGRRGNETVVYDKGGWVFWMLLQHMGREAFLAGARDFIATWHARPDHDYPVIQDFVATMRPYAPDPRAFDEFAAQWFFSVAIPEYRIEQSGKRDLGAGEWEVTARIANAGTARMPVEIAAVRGQRFDETGGISKDYEDARTKVVLGAGEEKEVRIRCRFEPQRLVVDPDAHVLQLQRRAATARL
jgi:ABC-2 type transport system permease protein